MVLLQDIPSKYQGAKILLVDDEPSNLNVLKRMLIELGYDNVMIAEGGEKGLALYLTERPDLMLLDIKMPGLNGFEVMQQLNAEKEEEGYLPIIVVTAQGNPETCLKALVNGAKDFITKPYELAEIIARINNVLEVRLLHKLVLGQNKSLEERVNERTRELEKTRMEVINRLGRASEYRDNETGLHVIRMSLFSEMLSREAGIQNYQCRLIRQASPMHDVGKIGIPDHILMKPGSLTKTEWEIMKTHSEIGAMILSGSDSALMSVAESIALNHHEQWSGGGYPNGIAGEEIPLEARIVTICDVYDALTSERPYKKPWAPEDAMTEIESQSGILFDPELVKTFKRCLPGLIEISTQYSDQGKTYLQKIC